MKEKILVVEDDPEFRSLTQTWLQNAGYEVITAEHGQEGLRRVFSSRPNLVLLDVNMPKLDGWEVCKRIREMSEIPIMMMTVNNQVDDRLRGFNNGADDYIAKPVDFQELLARVKSILRRTNSGKPESDEPVTFDNGEIEIDWRSRQVWVRKERVKLSNTEFKILATLIKNRGWIVTHEQLLEKAWGPNYIGDKSFVKLYIRYLRKKIDKDPQNPKYILTERGVGYYFALQDESSPSFGS